MPRFKYVCNKCGHLEPLGKWDWAKEFIGALLMIFGIVFIIFIIVVGPMIAIDGVLEGIGVLYARAYSDDVRHLALNLTTYSGDQPFKWALDLAQNIKEMRYVPASPYKFIQAPEDTALYGGDCKNTAIIYTSMLTTLSVPAKIDCSVKDRHCVTRINDPPYYMIVDFAGGFWAIFNESADFWNGLDMSVASGLMYYEEPLSVVEPAYFKNLKRCCDEVTGECYQREFCEWDQ